MLDSIEEDNIITLAPQTQPVGHHVLLIHAYSWLYYKMAVLLYILH